jgi:serine/threonine protein kinase
LAGLVSDSAGSPAFWAPEVLAPSSFDVGVGLDLNDHDHDTHCDIGTGMGMGSDQCAADVLRYSAYTADVWALGVTLHTLLHGKVKRSMYTCSHPPSFIR